MTDDTKEFYKLLLRLRRQLGLPGYPTDEETRDFFIQYGADIWIEGGQLYVHWPVGKGFYD